MTTAEHTTTVTCDCGNDFELHDSTLARSNRDDVRCPECHEQDMLADLRECLDPDHDGAFSRPDALRRLKNHGEMPIVDYDGGRIEELDVEYGQGFGCEPNGHWVERMVKITDCPECGYSRAKESYKANAGVEPMRNTSCPDCGLARMDGH